MTIDYILPSSKVSISDKLINWVSALNIPPPSSPESKLKLEQKKKKLKSKLFHLAVYTTFQNLSITLDGNNETLSTLNLDFMEIIIKDIPKDTSHHYSLDLNLKELNLYFPEPQMYVIKKKF